MTDEERNRRQNAPKSSKPLTSHIDSVLFIAVIVLGLSAYVFKIEVGHLRDEASDLKSLFDQQNDEFADSESSLQEMQQLFEKSSREKDSLQRQIDSLQRARTREQGLVQDLEQGSEQLQNQYEELEQELEELLNQNEEFEKDLENAVIREQRRVQDLWETQAESQVLRDSLEKKIARIKQLKSEMENFVPIPEPEPEPEIQIINEPNHSINPEFPSDRAEIFSIGGGGDYPLFRKQVIVDPFVVNEGEEQTYSIWVKDPDGIASVTATVLVDNSVIIRLQLVEGTNKDGRWVGSWMTRYISSSRFRTVFRAESIDDEDNELTMFLEVNTE